MNTVIRLLVLIPAMPLAVIVGLIMMSGANQAPFAFALGLSLIAAPPALIVWTLIDHRKRSHAYLKASPKNHA